MLWSDDWHPVAFLDERYRNIRVTLYAYQENAPGLHV
jgi:hypothetical protein